MAKYRFDNMDGAENAFFARQLEHIRPGMFEVKYGDLVATDLIPINTSVHPGAEVFTYRTMDMVGKAELSTDYSKTGPSADVSSVEETSKIRSMKSSYRYSLQEARNAMMAGVDLDPRKAKAARTAIAQLMDDVLLIGDGTAAYLGLYGLLKVQSPVTYTVPNGASGAKTFASKTPEEICVDLHGVVNKVVADSLGIEQPDTMGMPLAQYQDISTRRMGDGSDVTVLRFFLGTTPYIKSVVPIVKAATAGSGSTTRLIVYRKDPDCIEGVVPVVFEQLPPQFDGYQVITHCHARVGGVIPYRPKSVGVADGV